jgi:Uma2 family endonuclease
MAEVATPIKSEVREDEEDLSLYPSSDGEPMGETGWHVKQLAMLIDTVDAYFASAPKVLVLGNVLLYYEKGDYQRFVVPDLYVVHGVPKEPLRRSYFAWRAGKFPDFILELLSESTAARDWMETMVLYEQTFRTTEYFLCDPWERSLTGYRLRRGSYHRLPADAQGRIISKSLGLMFGWEGDWLRVYRLDSSLLPTPQELAERSAQLTQEVSELSDENARLRAELERLKAQMKGRGKKR